MIIKQILSNQVQRKSCGYFSCQVRNLFLCVEASVDRNDNIQWKRHFQCPKLTTNCNFNQHLYRNYSRFSANTILNGMDIMKLSDYDCIGFDLDNTLLRYKLTAMVELEYDVLANFLVTTKGYPPHRLLRPMQENIDFLQRGLIRMCFRIFSIHLSNFFSIVFLLLIFYSFETMQLILPEEIF